MKIAVTIARYLLGLIFLVFGLNGFFHFIPMPPPEGVAAQFFGALYVSHYLVVIMLLQVIGGAVLLWGSYVPLALILLGPVIVNILLFHSFMAPAGLPLAFFVAFLWIVVAYNVRSALAGIFVKKVNN